MYRLGIDIAGAPGGNFHLSLINWGPEPHASPQIHWGLMHLPLTVADGYPDFDFPQIRAAASPGNIDMVADLSFPIYDFVRANLDVSVVNLCHAANIERNQITVVGIDSPSGFSRNTMGHGRVTEKVAPLWGIGLNGNFRVVFQMTPSVACGRPHGAEWYWMLFGMAAFYAFESNFHHNLQGWRNYLLNGLAIANQALPWHVIEVFPRATIQYLRSQNHHIPAANIIQNFLDNMIMPLIHNSHDQISIEALNRINEVLQNGEPTMNDYADALIAALTTLPSIMPDQYHYMTLEGDTPTDYAPLPPNNRQQEGRIFLLQM